MLASAINQLAMQRAVGEPAPTPIAPVPGGRGRLAASQLEGFRPERPLSLMVPRRIEVSGFGRGQELVLGYVAGTVGTTVELGAVYDIGSIVGSVAPESAVLGGQPREQANPAADARAILATLRHLVEREQLPAARALLDAAPLSVLSDPLVAKLRALLAPPTVARVRRHDVDRRSEYEWLRAEGQKYRGRWGALDGDTLIASAPSLRELREHLRNQPATRPPLLHRVD